MKWEHDRGGRDTRFQVTYRAGARSTRCFQDIQSQFSDEHAHATAREAIRLMPEVDKIFPDDPRPQLKRDEEPLIVVAFLLAGGLAPDKARKLADSVYSKADGSAELSAHGFRPPST